MDGDTRGAVDLEVQQLLLQGEGGTVQKAGFGRLFQHGSRLFMDHTRAEEGQVLARACHVIGDSGSHLDCEQHGSDLIKETGGTELRTESSGELFPRTQIIERL